MYEEINYFVEADKYNTVKLQALQNVREISPQYQKRFRWSERHLQCIWFDERYRPDKLTLSSGESCTIITPGTWNMEAGPDFLDAQIMIEPGSRLLRGDVEIHIYPSDWDHHKHSGNPNYDNVVLHVSWFKSPPAKTLPKNILSLSLSEKMLARPWISITDIDIKAYPHNTLPQTPRPCQSYLQNNPDYTYALLLAAGYHRLQNKTMTITRSLEDRAEREQILYEEFMAALGYKQNKTPFRALAKIVPLTSFTESRDHNLAILLGAARLLPQPDAITNPSAAKYIRTLWDIWWKSGQDELDQDILWTLHGLRPNNHPTRRLAAAAALFSGRQNIIMQLDEINTGDSGKDWINKVIKSIDQSTLWPFWNERLLFNSTPSDSHSYKLLGRKRISAILTNIIIPFYAAEKRLPLNTFKSLPAEDISSPMRTAAFYILGRDHNPALYATNNLLQQGLLQIYLDFCLPARTSCQECRLNERIKSDLSM
ncbi:MAG: DUF2851 family protein [Kiritimatiellae bacterium]|jgi:hypothetical protein|nr:DUF2851 family protein [Kiritimatiellia bacterium]